MNPLSTARFAPAAARFVSIAAVAAMFALAGCQPKGGGQTAGGDSTNAGAPQTKVGLVFDVGGRGDKSFNDAAYAGLERAESELTCLASGCVVGDSSVR
jgi:basic membrane protein A